MTRGILLLAVFLAACGTPQERCIQRETRDLRTVDKLIAETETNLKRGYAVEEVTVWRTQWEVCEVQPAVVVPPGGTPPRPKMCLEDVPETVRRPKAINLADERQKLLELQKKRSELIRVANAAVAQCKATYPE